MAITEGKGPAMDQPASRPDQAGTSREGALAALRRWLANQALLATPVPAVATGFAEGLLKVGIPLWRAHVAVSMLDPQMEGVGLTWTRVGGRQREVYGHGSFDDISKGSPI